MAKTAESVIGVVISNDELDRPFICKPCGEDGEKLRAVGLCVTCSESLCRKCYDVHLIPSLTRKHVLKRLEKEHTSDTEPESKYSCKLHGYKDIEYHCTTHSFFGCHVCCFQHQKSCENVILISEVRSSSEQCGQFYQKLTNITNKCTKLVSEIKSSLGTITTKHMKTVTYIKEFKHEILEMIEKLENELVVKVDKIKVEETARIKELSIKCKTLLSNAQKMSAAMEMLQNKNKPRELYIELIQSKDKVLDLENQINTIEKNKKANMPDYKLNKELANLLKNPRGLGCLKQSFFEKLEHVRDINCRSTNDPYTCCIVGSVLLPEKKLIITDWPKGNSIKLIDLQQIRIQSDLKLLSPAWGICKINDNSVAVTLPDNEKVTLLRTDPKLAVDRDLRVNGTPRGIGHLDGKLVISYRDPCKIEVMDMHGIVIKTFISVNNEKTLFKWPGHVAIHPENKHIYVSNYNINNVVCMTLDGAIVATYKDNKLRNPRQVTFDSSGMVYVCGEGSHNIHQITEDCQKVNVTTKDGLDGPFSISYDGDEGLVYIGQWGNNSIKVYRVASSFI